MKNLLNKAILTQDETHRSMILQNEFQFMPKNDNSI